MIEMPGPSASLLDWALFYADLNFPVFPVHTVVKGRCSCGCSNPNCRTRGKHPRTWHGLDDATTDKARIRKWWKDHPDSNIGISCQGFLTVLDVDPRNGGMESFGMLQENFGYEVFETPISDTGGGGLQLFFRTNGLNAGNTTSLIAPGIDTKALGGYIVPPPSLHYTGKRYQWREGYSLNDKPLAFFPESLANEIKRQSKNVSTVQENGHIPESRRNTTLHRIAGALRRQGLDQPGILAALLGINSSKCSPPLAEREVEGIASSICRHAPDKIILVDDTEESQINSKPDVFPEAPSEEAKKEDNPKTRPFIETLPSFMDRVSQLPCPKCLMREIILEEVSHLFHGQPRDGKTWAVLEILIALATGTPGFSLDRLSVPEPVAVGYFTEEDPGREVFRRLTWLFAGRGISKFPDSFFICVRRGLNIDNRQCQQRLIDEVKSCKLKFAVIDPFRSFTAHADQGPAELKPVADFIRRFQGETGCAPGIVHHDSKPVVGKADERRRPQRASGGGIFSIADAPIHCERIDSKRFLVVPSLFKFSEDPVQIWPVLWAGKQALQSCGKTQAMET